MIDLALLLVRLVFGFTFAAHGAQKLFGWFGGYGIAGTGGWMESLGLKPGKFHATMAGLAELIGGLLLAAGVLTPVAAVLVTATMLVAIAKVHNKSYWVTANGSEYNVAIITTSIALAIAGPGQYTLLSLVR